MMKLDDFNLLLAELDTNPGRDQIIKTAFAILNWLGIKPTKDGKERVLAPKKEELKKYLTRHPVTNQFQLYRLNTDNEPITIRLAFLKKFRKDHLTQLIDKEDIVHFQGAPSIIQSLPSAPPYSLHIVATPEQNKLFVILNKGDQKRIISFKKKLTQTQFHKIIPQWHNIGTKSKPEISEQLWMSLDIKEVNKEFYKKIKEQFDSLVGIAKKQNREINEDDIKQFAVRLIGRYIFCWFLKEKGIISEKLLSSSTIQANRKVFFQSYLYQLFFNTLNEEVQSRTPFNGGVGIAALYDTIPYLNGGLFEKHPEDSIFQALDLNDWLISFVRVLEDFDFTVDESSNQYQQVAIDPEMLGRIFENLLASQNPETEKMANQRKAFGAFYTPREIVDYMVNQALKSYLEEGLLPKDENETVAEEPLVAYKGTLFEDQEPKQTLINFDPAKKAIADQRRRRLKEHIDKFFSPDCTSLPFDKHDVPLVQQKLSDVKILDPACGSGAFPMGILLRLMELRQLVGHGHRNNYDLKSEILNRNIYGVDIMPMAVEIARLRAWLSLVLEAEYKPQDRKNNFGVSALPNLDFKFVCANSLIDNGYDGFIENLDSNNATTATLFRLDGEVQKLERIRDNYFDPRGDKQRKVKLQKEFTQTKNYIKTEFASLKKTWNLGDFLNKVDDWNPFDDSHPSSFFSPAWMFGIKKGFDVVIGNPPYVTKLNENDIKYFQKEYQTIQGKKYDLFRFFIEKGINLNSSNGILIFIVPDVILHLKQASKLRKFILDNCLVKQVLKTPLATFTASVEPVIVAFQKGNKRGNVAKLINLESGEIISSMNQDTWYESPDINFDFEGIKSDNKIINKIKQLPLTISSVSIWKKGLGVYSRQHLLNKFSPKEVEKIMKEKPWTKDFKADKTFGKEILGKDISRYFVKWNEKKWLSYGPWLAFQRPIEFFKGPRLVVREITLNAHYIVAASYEEREYYNNQSIFNGIMKRENGYSLKFLLGLINSRLFSYYVLATSPKSDRTLFPTILMETIELFPIPKLDQTNQKPLISLVEKILLAKPKKKDTSPLEKEIDILVYRIYDLTYQEVKIVDPNFWLSEEEYNTSYKF